LLAGPGRFNEPLRAEQIDRAVCGAYRNAVSQGDYAHRHGLTNNHLD
jgi:hypothetical protein